MLVEAVTDYAIYMLDPGGIVTSWNPGARRFKGYEEAEIIGEHFSRFYTDEDRATGLPQRALETAAREGKFEAEGWRVRKDGTRFWAYVIIDPIRDSGGTLLGYAKVTRDLTERRAAEAELRKSQEQFRLLVQGVTDYAIYLLTPQGNVSSWNSGAERIKGYKPEEIIGQHFSRFYTEEDRNAGRPAIALEAALEHGRFEREGVRVRKDGSTFWAHVIIDVIHDAEGGLLGFAKITRDVTERKKTEEALERTREALIQSQKMEAIGHLTGGVAHDFNNLLMAIQGSLELLQRRMPPDPQLSQFLDNALQGAQRGAALTQRMLAFARRQDLNLQPVDVPDLIRGMTNLLQSSLGPSVQIETHFPLSLPKISGDANQLELAILNLSMNARDAMPNRRRHRHLGKREERDGRDRHQGWALCMPFGHGHRQRHGRADAPPGNRTLLHDKRRRQRNRAWSADGPWHGGAVGRQADTQEQARSGHYGRALPAGSAIGTCDTGRRRNGCVQRAGNAHPSHFECR